MLTVLPCSEGENADVYEIVEVSMTDRQWSDDCYSVGSDILDEVGCLQGSLTLPSMLHVYVIYIDINYWVIKENCIIDYCK